MKRKYSIITGFMSKLQDRFFDYQPKREMEQIVEMASQVEKCSGLEVVYPQNFKDPVKLKALLDSYGLEVSTVNLNIKSEEKFRYGSFSNPDPNIRKEALEYLKTAMDASAELGCNIVTTAMLNDGSDYPFELDYGLAFEHVLEGVSKGAAYRDDVKISLEYKASEPRAHCLLNNAGKMAYLCELTDHKNVGVTLDFGHALQCLEVPADSAAFLGTTGKLFYIHINDNYRNWDWDLLPGTVNYLDFIEFMHTLKNVGYDGWVTADVFPGRHDPIETMRRTFDWMDKITDIAEKIDDKMLSDMRRKCDTYEILDYIRELM